MWKKGSEFGAQNFTTIFIALVEMITAGFNISAQKREHATDDFIDELFQIYSGIPVNGAKCTVDGMKLHTEKYSGGFIPYILPKLFKGCEIYKPSVVTVTLGGKCLL
jgi:hypothetical protein